MTRGGAQPDAGREEVLFPFPLTLPSLEGQSVLPLNTGVPILPTQSAQITGLSHTRVPRVGRLMISNMGTVGEAADWIVNDLKINEVSQFSSVRQGAVFLPSATDEFLRWDAAPNALDVVVLVVTYVGLNEKGCPFFGALCVVDALKGRPERGNAHD